MYHKPSQVVAQCHFGASNLKVSETRESHIYKPGIPPKLTVIMMQVDYITDYIVIFTGMHNRLIIINLL